MFQALGIKITDKRGQWAVVGVNTPHRSKRFTCKFQLLVIKLLKVSGMWLPRLRKLVCEGCSSGQS